MQRKPSFIAGLFLAGLVIFQGFSPSLEAQAAPPPTPDQLDQLLAPIALYPDSLLAQITTASTNPQEILDVDNWLADHQDLTGTALTDAAQQQGFDPAFVALVNFPQVLEMMAEHIDDYAAIGQAFSADQGEVSASIQRLRSQAYASGALRSTPQQQVEVQQTAGQPTYIIQPVNPQVVYVPQYDPTVVYVRPSSGAFLTTSLIGFGVGIGIGALLVGNRPWGWGGWGWNWGGHRAYYNHAPWGGWNNGYRPSRPWYRPRPVVYGNRPGYRGNWNYRPRNYQPPSPTNRPGFNRPGFNRPGSNRPGYNPPNNRPAFNGPGNRPGNGNRPSVQPNRPAAPNNRPGYNPPNNRPAFNGPGNRPGNGNRPSVQPNRPAAPNYRPGSVQPSTPNTNRSQPNRTGPARPAANHQQPNAAGNHRSDQQARPDAGRKDNKKTARQEQR